MNAASLDTDKVAGRTILWVDSERIEECMDFYRSNEVDCLGVNPMRGFASKNLGFLSRYPFIRDLMLVSPTSGDFDLEPVMALTGLQSLTISAPLMLPLREFPDLRVVRGMWHPKLDLSGCAQLRVLDLSGYKPRSKDLTELPVLPSLCELVLVQAVIASLRGIGRQRGLERVELAYIRTLKALAGLEELPSLARLQCERCSGIEDLSKVARLRQLRSLRLNGCGKLASVRFLDDMPDLEEFRFVDTTVIDGDLRPLLRLKWVGFLRKKHYSHTPEQLDEILRRKGGGAVPRVE